MSSPKVKKLNCAFQSLAQLKHSLAASRFLSNSRGPHSIFNIFDTNIPLLHGWLLVFSWHSKGTDVYLELYSHKRYMKQRRSHKPASCWPCLLSWTAWCILISGMHLDFWAGILNSISVLLDACKAPEGWFCLCLEFTTEPVGSTVRYPALCAAQEHVHDFRLGQWAKR